MLVERSIAELHGAYQKPLHYLHLRGFTEATIAAAQFSYQPCDQWAARSDWGLEPDGERTKLWLPRGTVISWFVDGQLWRVYISRPTGKPKSYCLPGGSHTIYDADTIQPDLPLLLVEAALDALAIQQEAGDLGAAAATGTTGGRCMRWIGRIGRAPAVLLDYNNDYQSIVVLPQGGSGVACLDLFAIALGITRRRGVRHKMASKKQRSRTPKAVGCMPLLAAAAVSHSLLTVNQLACIILP